MRGLLLMQFWPVIILTAMVRIHIDNLAATDEVIRASLGLKSRPTRPALELYEDPDELGWQFLSSKKTELAKVLDCLTIEEASTMPIIRTRVEASEQDHLMPGASLTNLN